MERDGERWGGDREGREGKGREGKGTSQIRKNESKAK